MCLKSGESAGPGLGCPENRPKSGQTAGSGVSCPEMCLKSGESAGLRVGCAGRMVTVKAVWELVGKIATTLRGLAMTYGGLGCP